MPIPRNTDRPQISLDTGVYGDLPWEGMPDGDPETDAQIFYWHKNTYGGGQWVSAVIMAGVGMDIDFDSDTGVLSITNRDYRVYASATMDALLVVTTEESLTSDAELV